MIIAGAWERNSFAMHPSYGWSELLGELAWLLHLLIMSLIAEMQPDSC